MLRRILSIVLVCSLLLTSIPLPAAASDDILDNNVWDDEADFETEPQETNGEYIEPTEQETVGATEPAATEETEPVTEPEITEPAPTETTAPPAESEPPETTVPVTEPEVTEGTEATEPTTEPEVTEATEPVVKPEETVPPANESGEQNIPETAVEEFTYYTTQTEETGEETIVISSYNGSDANVVVPREINGVRVTIIGSEAFNRNTTVQKVVIPEGITKIADGSGYGGAFAYCTALTQVEMPKSLTHLGSYTFYDCPALVSVELGENLTSIGYNAFYKCPALTAITLPDNIQSLGSVFSYCENLQTVVLPKNLKVIESGMFSGCKSLKEIKLPMGLEKIESGAFSNTGITKLELPDSVTEVSLSGLHSQLTYLRWTAGIPEINGSQFQGMSALETVVLPEGVTSIADGGREIWSDGWNTHVYHYGAFRDSTSLKNVELPNTLKNIGAYAFEGCSSLETIQLGAGITEVGEYAFDNCSQLKKVVFNNGLESIGSCTFNGCSLLETVDLPDTLTEIENNAFSDCTGIKVLDLGNSVKTIGDSAFSNCTGITKVVFPDSLETIGSDSFRNTSLTEVELPQNLKTLGDAFGGTSITKLYIPDSVTSAEFGSLKSQLTDIRWTVGIPVVPARCFMECVTLKNVILPEGITEIADGGVDTVIGILQNFAYPYAPFMNCYSLESLVLPESLTRIGYMAFRGCTSLSFIQVGKNLTEISSNVFTDCPEMTMAVWSGSYGEQYAIEHNIDYTYVDMNGKAEVTLNAGLYQGMLLTLQCEDVIRTQKITSASSYRFSGLKEGSVAKLYVKNSRGDIVKQIEDVEILRDTKIQFPDVNSMGSVTIKILDDNGNDVTADVSVEWFDSAKIPYASGSAVKQILSGTELTGKIRLNESYGQVFYAPADVKLTVKPGNQEETVRLVRIPIVEISGTVTNGRTELAGAAVVIAQTINEKYVKRTTVLTEKDGSFVAEVPAVSAQITIAAYGYMDHAESIQTLMGNTDMGTITLAPITGEKLRINGTYQKSVQEGKTAGSNTLTDLNDLDISVYNKTKGCSVSGIVRQGTTLVLTEGAAPGDELKLTISSFSQDFQPVTVNTALKSTGNTELSISLTQLGSVHAVFPENANRDIRILIFDANGNRAWTGSGKTAQLELTSGQIVDGTYTVVLMGESSFFTYPDTWNGFQLAGLQSGSDYISKQISVSAGKISECSFQSVPTLDESRFYYTDISKTGYSTSKTSISAGKFFTLRATAAFMEQYAGRVTDIQWIFELPGELEYYDGTLNVGGKTDTAYTYQQGTLTVPVEDPSQMIRFCVNAIGQGEVSSTAYLEFTYQGKRIRQPVNTVTVSIDALDFSITGKTFVPTVRITGTAAGGAEIQVYDNDVLVGQTQATASGNWAMTFDLYQPGSYSRHNVYALMQLATGTQVRSQTHTVTYQYSPDPIAVDTVTMFFGDSSIPSVIFDFEDPQVKNMSYTVVGGATLSFLANFKGGEISRLSDVQMEVDLTNGTTRTLQMTYSADRNGYIASDYFDISALPVNVGVSYLYDGEFVFSGEQLTEVKNAVNEVQNILPSIEMLTEEMKNDAIEAIELGAELEAEMPQELYEQIEEYNAMLENYIAAEKQFVNVMETLYGKIEVNDNHISSSGGMCDMSIEQFDLPQFSIEDKVAEGFSVYRIGDSQDDFILVRQTMSEQLDMVEYEIIDTTGSNQGYGGTMATLSRSVKVIDDFDASNESVQNSKMYRTRSEIKDDPELESTFDIAVGVTEGFQKVLSMLSNMSAVGEGISEDLSEWRKKVFNKHIEKSKEWVSEKDPVKAEKIKAELDAEFSKIEKIDKVVDRVSDGLKVLKPVADVVGPVGDALGLVFNPKSIYEDRQSLKKLIEIEPSSGDNSVTNNIAQLRARIATNVFSAAGAMLGLAAIVSNFMKWPMAATLINMAKFHWGFALAALIVGGLYLLWQCDSKIDGETERIMQKYSGGNAGGTGQPMIPKIDPSGYIYEAVASNRLTGVTVTCYEKLTRYDMFDEPYEEIQLWDAEEFDQRNPLKTDGDGRYAWDVPGGWWQVKAEMDGYETTYSDWLPVPPPQLEVNLGMVSYESPVIETVEAAPGAIDITFSKYMRADLFAGNSVKVFSGDTRLNGRLELLDEEENPKNSEETFVRTVRFVPGSKIAEETEIKVSVSDRLRSYADADISGDLEKIAKVTARPESLTSDAKLTVAYQNSGTVRVQATPANAVAGKKVTVSVGYSEILKVTEDNIVLDESGTAVIHVTGMLPGSTHIMFALEGSKLKAETEITVTMSQGCEGAHSVVVDEAVAASCTAPGWTEGKHCSECGEVILEQKKIPVLGHDYVEGICSRCDSVEPGYIEPTEPTAPDAPSEPAVKSVSRLAGSSRYETSFAIANQMKKVMGIDKFETIVLANSDSFADALAGSYLAAVKKAPIIIAKPKYAGIVCEYLNANLAAGGTIYILGGTTAMPDSILNDLSVENAEPVRLEGKDRYATNLAILDKAHVSGKDILVATGQDFADSLSASATGLPILLVNGKPGKTLSDAQKEFLANVEGKIYIIGGESAVPVSMVEQIEVASGKKTERIAGGSRYETSVKIAEKFLKSAESAVVAYASTFPDGLCGGPLAYAVGAPLILTKDGKSEAPDYTTGNNITSGYVLGGDGLISDGFAKTIFQATEIIK